ncbi:hypothetical protein LIER_09263 [Lithospermum erythrorhizon]|uniref:Secreted protein n=1 Tax=Lithospermum erythrorhizon TaxID=34254 RepID=A0AAV3PIX8_LITER
MCSSGFVLPVNLVNVGSFSPARMMASLMPGEKGASPANLVLVPRLVCLATLAERASTCCCKATIASGGAAGAAASSVVASALAACLLQLELKVGWRAQLLMTFWGRLPSSWCFRCLPSFESSTFGVVFPLNLLAWGCNPFEFPSLGL